MANDFDLPISLPQDAVAAVVGAIRHAGDIAARSYSEQDLWDATAFGAVLWRLGWNHAAEGLHRLGMKTWFDENSLRFELNGFECAIYSGGHDAMWDVHRYDFNRTAKREQTANPAQERLFDLRQVEPPPIAHPENLKSLTFVYCGNPLHGTVAVYLGAPVVDGSVFRWGWVECLFRLEDGPTAETNVVPDLPSFEQQPEGGFELPTVKESETGEGSEGAAG